MSLRHSSIIIKQFLPLAAVMINIIFSAQDRPTELIGKLRGVLTNPNCEFYPNFVAIHTLATWCKATADGGPRDVEMGKYLVILFFFPSLMN